MKWFKIDKERFWQLYDQGDQELRRTVDGNSWTYWVRAEKGN